MKISDLPEAQRGQIQSAREKKLTDAQSAAQVARAAATQAEQRASDMQVIVSLEDVAQSELDALSGAAFNDVLDGHEQTRFAHILPLGDEPARPTGAILDGSAIAFPAQSIAPALPTQMEALDQAQQKQDDERFAHVTHLVKKGGSK
jgi:hypothetical protein